MLSLIRAVFCNSLPHFLSLIAVFIVPLDHLLIYIVPMLKSLTTGLHYIIRIVSI